MRAVYVTTYNGENNIKSTLNSVHLLRPCSLWSVFTHFLLIYLPVCCPLFLPLSPNLSFCFLSSPLLCSVSPLFPQGPMLVTPWHKNQRVLLTSSLPFHHFIITSLRQLDISVYFWWHCFPRKMALLVKITHTLNHQNILGQHKALMFSKS